MYNSHLETFLKVAALGSFSAAAAESMFISPSAVIQQMNALEDELGVKLFLRTHKGVALTEEGKYLQSEAGDYVRKGLEVRRRLQVISGHQHTVVVGTNIDYKVRLIYNIWTEYKRSGGEESIRLDQLPVEVRNTADYDIIEGIRSSAAWQGYMQFEKLTETPLGVGMRYDHPLASRERLTMEDLRPYRLLMSKNNVPPNGDELIRSLQQHQIYHELVADYDPNIIWESARTQGMILLPETGGGDQQDIFYRPVDWEIRVDYGIFYHFPYSGPERGLIDFILRRKKEGCKFDI